MDDGYKGRWDEWNRDAVNCERLVGCKVTLFDEFEIQNIYQLLLNNGMAA